MISEQLKELIIPNLKMHMDEEDWKYIPEMFSEVYWTTFGGVDRVTLKPHPEAGSIAVQFSPLNGAYIEITDWDYIKKIGKLV